MIDKGEPFSFSSLFAQIHKIFLALQEQHQNTFLDRFCAILKPSSESVSAVSLKSTHIERKKKYNISHLLCLLSKSILFIEDRLVRKGTSIKSEWTVGRNRFKWRQRTRAARTFAQLAISTHSLIESIEWEKINSAITPITRKMYAQSLPGEEGSDLNGIPVEGSSVIYYPEGHLMAFNADKASSSVPMWGEEMPKITDRKSVV